MDQQTPIPFPRALKNIVLVRPGASAAAAATERPPVSAARAAPPTTGSAIGDQQPKIDELLRRFGDLAAELRQAQQQRLREMQQAAVELAVAVASRLVHQMIAANDYPIESLVRHVVAQLDPGQPITVYLHPADLALLQTRLKDRGVLDDDRAVRLLADVSLARGDCRAESADVHLLSQLQQQIQALRDNLLRGLAQAETERRHPSDHNLRRFPERRQTA